MIQRTIKPLKSNSFFLFGPRGTGKTTLLKELFPEEKTLWIDLLEPNTEDRLLKNPSLLSEQVAALGPGVEWIIVDEVQKVPRILDVVHHIVENSSLKFALTGSSARKLKRGASNLLAGRAFVYELFPFTHLELEDQFNLEETLSWGTLPRLSNLKTDGERTLFLESYSHTYLKEEIIAEQIIRKDRPFRLFLEVAAQSNGEVLNYSKIAHDIGVDSKTVRSYYEILEDTLVGFFLPAYHRSLRKQQSASPKFYLFDTGVKRALDRALDIPLRPGTYAFGRAFEHFVILEMYHLNSYHRKNFRFYHLLTKDGAEIDLLIERPGKPLALVEIKSANEVDGRHIRTLTRFAKEMSEVDAFCLSRDPQPRRIDSVQILPWDIGLKRLGLE